MTVYALGEALIDFVPNRSGGLSDDVAFLPAVGGAPLNVAAAVAKLGGQSAMIGQVGQDDFGDLIISVLKDCGVKTNYLLQTDEAKTALAFVTLQDNGERSFSFYRNPSADMLYRAENLEKIVAKEGDILHFCSVSLASDLMRRAHEEAIKKWRAVGASVSFDINIRLPLWPSIRDCVEAVFDFIPKAHIIKISDDELSLLFPDKTVEEAVLALFSGHVRYVIYTKGANGAEIYNKDGLLASASAHKVDAVDATGAGDAFTGALLYLLQSQKRAANVEWSKERAQKLLQFATAVGALATLKRGAVNSLPTQDEVRRLIKYA